MRVLVCGSRTYDDQIQLYAVLNGLALSSLPDRGEVLTIVEGEASGADRIAAQWAVAYAGAQPEPHPADWNAHGKAAGFIRNIEMLDSGVDLVIAFYDRGVTSGTAHTVTNAKQRGLPVWEIFSNKRALP